LKEGSAIFAAQLTSWQQAFKHLFSNNVSFPLLIFK
jgi:hypothetical protein